MTTAQPIPTSESERPSGGPEIRVIEADFRRDTRWIEFLSKHRDALIYHHPGWLSALEAEYGRECVTLACEGSDGKFLGVLPLLSTRGLPLRLSSRNRVVARLSSLPRTPLAGPLATDDRVMTALLRAAIQKVQTLTNTQLEIKTLHPGLEKLVPELECVPWRETYVRGTPSNQAPVRDMVGPQMREPRTCTSCDECRILTFGSARDNHRARWAANKASKQGVSLRDAQNESELRAWYSLYLRVMRRNTVPPRPYRFFRQLWKELAADGHMELMLAEREAVTTSLRENPDVSTANQSAFPHSDTMAGSVLLQYGHTAFWAFTGLRDEGAPLHATDLIVWNGIHTACRRGYDYFDLGEVAENHPELSQFKAKWGTFRRPMYRYYYPALAAGEFSDHSHDSRMVSLAASVWRRLPLAVTALLGDWIFRYL